MPFLEIPDRFRTPSDNLSIARYFSEEKFISLLETSSIYLRRMDLFPNKDEIVLSLYDINWIRQTQGDKAEMNIDIYNKEKSWSFISCWTLETTDWRRFWEEYGNKSNAVMVKVSVKRLKTELNKSEITTFMPIVLYFDIIKHALGIFNSIRMLSRNPLDFKWEQEVRIIVFNFRPKEPLPESMFIPVNLNNIIEEIIVSPFATEEFMEMVRGLLLKKGFSTKILSKSRIKLS